MVRFYPPGTNKWRHVKQAEYTCEYSEKQPNFPFIRGANLGGWLVLEPWIVPSLFYQFQNKPKEETAMDIYTFCEVLGPEEGKRQLNLHWANWVQEEDIAKLAEYGLNSVRIPVGDWMYKPYGPYVGCTDGALEHLDRVLDLVDKYGMKALIDIHGVIGSQNGFDNSGQARNVVWTSEDEYEHWPIIAAEWLGDWDLETQSYKNINYENIAHTLEVVDRIVEKYKDHPGVLGLEPVNEPWANSPENILKDYYWKSYNIVRSKAPDWQFIFHGSFRFQTAFWSGFLKNCPNVALDTHIYQAWANKPLVQYLNDGCGFAGGVLDMEEAGIPTIVGEFSLATDNCAMWLNGFNDNLPGYPLTECHFEPCPLSSIGLPGPPDYMSPNFDKPGASGPKFGMCPAGSPHEDNFMEQLAKKQLNAFSRGHGWYFWNFKTDGNLEPRWSYIGAVEKGWIPRNMSLDIVPSPLDGHCESNACKFKAGVDFYGGDLYALPTSSSEGCCEACRIEPQCRAFTFAGATKFCYLKTGKYEAHYFADFISGTYDPKWEIPGYVHMVGEELEETTFSDTAEEGMSSFMMVMAMVALISLLAVKFVIKHRRSSFAQSEQSTEPKTGKPAGFNYQLDALGSESADYAARSI